MDQSCGGGAIGLEMAHAAAVVGGGAGSSGSGGGGVGSTPSPLRVVGIELSASAVADARHNGALNGLRPPQYVVLQGKVEDAIGEALATLPAAAEGAGVVAVLDPPRTGVAPSVCKALRAAEAVDAVVFVSCNPHGHTLRHDYVVKGGSLASNARVLCGPRGRGRPFRLRRAVPCDLFPHTPHVELVVLFERVTVGARGCG